MKRQFCPPKKRNNQNFSTKKYVNNPGPRHAHEKELKIQKGINYTQRARCAVSNFELLF